jgi:hypothetical protein
VTDALAQPLLGKERDRNLFTLLAEEGSVVGRALPIRPAKRYAVCIMDITFAPPLAESPRNLVRRAGYAEFRDPNTGETSYVRRLTNQGFYPRFHVYLKESGGGFVVSLHLDQKRPSYGVGHAHSGEYGGPTVEVEAERIRAAVARGSAPERRTEPPRRGFFSRLLESK